MQAKTAKYAAMACFGLAAVIAVLWVFNVFDRKADVTPIGTCEYIALPKQGDVLPSGDWCFRVQAGQTLQLRFRTTFELDTSGIPDARIDVYDPDGRRYLDQIRTLTKPNECFRLTVPYSRMELTATKGPGVVRVRVGDPVNFRDRLTNC